MIRFAIAIACAGCLSKPEFPVVADPPVLVSHLTAGDKHVCAIDATGMLACWGNNHEDELGVPTPDRTGTPLTLGANWTGISAGTQHTCGIQGDTVVCWGDAMPIAPVPLPSPAAAIFAGGDGACAIDAGGNLYCWGLVDPASTPLAMPTQIMPAGIAGPWQEVRISADHACALTTAGDAYCWGQDDLEQLGVVGGNVAVANAVQPTTRQFLTLAAGPAATCGITTDHTLDCWGAPFATGGDMASAIVEIDSAPVWSGIAVGTAHVCGIDDHGVRCYGSDSRGALGDDFAARAMLPSTAVVDNALEVVAGDGFTCSRQDDDSKACWGTNERGELGNGEIATEPLPVVVDIGGTATHLTVGGTHTCATRADSTVMCWGDNRNHQVAARSNDDFDPAPVAAMVGADLITAGTNHTCARDSVVTSSISCWGDNSQLQTNGGVKVATTVSWSRLSASGNTTCAINAGGDLVCWGAVPTTGTSTAPALMAMQYLEVGVGPGFVTGVQMMTTSNNVVEWGDASGDCSLSAAKSASSPEFIDDAGNLPTQFATALGHACRMEGDATTLLYCWGANDRGQSGAASGQCSSAFSTDIVAPSFPWAQVLDTSLPQLSTGGNRSCAISSAATGNTLLCWGDNTGHFLAPMIAAEQTSVPAAAVPGAWATIAVGPNHACGIDKVTSKVMCWGPNEFGEVGNGFRFHADPVEVVAPEPPP